MLARSKLLHPKVRVDTYQCDDEEGEEGSCGKRNDRTELINLVRVCIRSTYTLAIKKKLLVTFFPYGVLQT